MDRYTHAGKAREFAFRSITSAVVPGRLKPFLKTSVAPRILRVQSLLTLICQAIQGVCFFFFFVFFFLCLFSSMASSTTGPATRRSPRDMARRTATRNRGDVIVRGVNHLLVPPSHEVTNHH